MQQFATGVSLMGTLNDCILFNLHLRTASQVLFALQSFHCNHPDDLYAAASKISWQNIIPKDGYFSITSNVFHPSIKNNMFANVRVKDAIVDVMKQKNGSRPNSGNELNKTVIHLHWKHTQAEIFIDTSGESLGRHGYRKFPGKAPMLEALAAATVLTTGYNNTKSFINPMCGSGTLAIEAAQIATNRKPGLLRSNYGFMHLLGYDDAFYTSHLQNLFNIITTKLPAPIIATDHSDDAIYIAQKNAGLADVEDFIQFDCCDFEKTKLPNTKGIVFLNPEYGERLGTSIALEDTYSRIGSFFKQQCAGFSGYVFTGNLELAKKIGLKPSRRTEFLNGKIECRLLQYELYEGSRRVEK
jgi:putative N6-adenine-specific DNA methylase